MHLLFYSNRKYLTFLDYYFSCLFYCWNRVYSLSIFSNHSINFLKITVQMINILFIYISEQIVILLNVKVTFEMHSSLPLPSHTIIFTQIIKLVKWKMTIQGISSSQLYRLSPSVEGSIYLCGWLIVSATCLVYTNSEMAT